MTWSGDYSQCRNCKEVYPYAITECPCCHSVCSTYVVQSIRGLPGSKRFELLGEQKQVLTMPPKGAVLIKGGAGSGKTLVAVKRAEYLTNKYSDMFQRAHVAIFAYNKELVHEIENLVSDDSVRIFNIDSWIFGLLRGAGAKLSLLDDRELRKLRAEARRCAFLQIATRAIAKKRDDFYEAEIRWLKGRRISSLEQYKGTKRTGRGTEDRVTAFDREYLWRMFEEYNRLLSKNGIRDWEDRVLDALKIVESPGFHPPYTHVVIDEAQDFSFAKIALVKHLVSPQTESITIVADSAQQIYQSGFSWSDLGIKVVGRSVEFKRNYRNTKQISEAAYSLLAHEKDNADFTHMENAVQEGAKPLIVAGDDSWNEKVLLKVLKAFPQTEDAVLAVPSRKLFPRMEALLKGAGIKITKSASEPKTSGSVRLSTFHALKGLQFMHVFLWAVSDWYFPTTDVDPDELSKLRKLLYVAMTRATQKLTIFTTSQPGRLITEINPSKVDFMMMVKEQSRRLI